MQGAVEELMLVHMHTQACSVGLIARARTHTRLESCMQICSRTLLTMTGLRSRAVVSGL